MEPVLQSKAHRSARMVAVATCCGPGCGHQIRALVYGGPVAEPAYAECVLRKTTGIHGFYGASSLDASPSNEPLTDQT
jgi:predicted TIM-barrel enzyme